jgi:pyruvate/2-oxoglutarate dehydrogenase complex dihydrolipoamide dehydrogenase (E3) component
VNARLQTTNPRIFAAGDICSRYKFTHAADAMAQIVIQNALFHPSVWLRQRRIPITIVPSPRRKSRMLGCMRRSGRHRGRNLQARRGRSRDSRRSR